MPPTKQDYRRVMGRFATGVTVITTAYDGQLHGMTANAVTSLSLNPMSVLVCVDKTADTHDILSHAKVFAVNILTREQQDISDRFAKKNAENAHLLDGVAYHIAENGCPVLDNCLAHLVCRTLSELEGGDHTIFIGEVLEASDEASGEPLLFYNGKYGRFEPA